MKWSVSIVLLNFSAAILIFTFIPSHDLYLLPFSPEEKLHSSIHDAMRPRRLESSYYSEIWTYHINLNNGFQIVYTFTIGEFGPFQKRNSDVKFQTSWLNGETFVMREKNKHNEFMYDSASVKIALHPEKQIFAEGSFAETHRLFFKADSEERSFYADFEIDSKIPPLLRGDGFLRLRQHKAGLTFPIPHGIVKGTLAVNGDTLKNIAGTVYMDHVFMTDMAFNLFERGYRIKTGNNAEGMTLTAFQPRDSTHLIGYGIEYIEGEPHLIEPVSHDIISTEALRDVTYARKVIIHFKRRKPLTIQIDTIYNDYSILDEYGGFKRFFAKRVVGSELIYFNGLAHSGPGKKVFFNNFVTD